ncbi:response regulator [Aurantivibrio plasticivorans]
MTSQSKKRDVVLVVDDTPETLSMLNDTLEQAGATVLVALEGQQALTIASNITPDIILMDALMPNMDGFETCKRLKAIGKLEHVPVIFMTGLSDSDSIVKGFDAGGVDYITKPVNGIELVARMQTHLNNARLTLSARSALDNAGQFLFATNNLGELKWGTPQAHQLFSRAGLDEAWLIDSLPQLIRKLLSPHFNKDKGINVSEGNQPLRVDYLGQTHSDEVLLQIVDMKKPQESEILKESLAITGREAEVLLWVARGKANREIATILSMSPRTVNKHLEQLFRKLNVENRTGAAIIALKHLSN